MRRALAAASLLVAVACSRAPPSPTSTPAGFDAAATLPAPLEASSARPACDDIPGGAWPRASDLPRVVASTRGTMGRLEQTWEGSSHRLRFVGAHAFDLLDKLAREAGPSEADRRVLACSVLSEVAREGAPVVRLWGSLKRTGHREEVDRAADLLELVLDENARRTRPLRFVVTLVNHQPGYGAPDPSRSLDDQDPASPWSARRFYLEGRWRASGHGLLAERIEAFAARPSIACSPYVLAWELVNELDTYRLAPAGSLATSEGRALAATFLAPALELAATRFAQPILAGEIRAAPEGYADFARALSASLAPSTRARLAWTSHVYARGDRRGPTELARAFDKLDRDLVIARDLGAPLLVGELGEIVEGGAPCEDRSPHALAPLLDALAERRADAIVAWGEGMCALRAGTATYRVGVGGDGADLGPNDPAREVLSRARRALLPE